jgi:hypothetical protein
VVDSFLSIHGLAVRKAAGVPAVAELVALPEAEVASALSQSVGDGLVGGARDVYMVLPAGQAWLAQEYPVRFADLRADQSFVAGFERFERVNTELLALFTDWETVPAGSARIPNDHHDVEYDRHIIDRLGALSERADRLLARLAGALPRMSRYSERLENAGERILGGNLDFVSGVRVESFHTVWYELHEDLLRILGRSRRE